MLPLLQLKFFVVLRTVKLEKFAFEGTVTVILLSEASVIGHFTPPKYTTLLAALAPKKAPLMVTELPTAPESGAIEVIFGTPSKVIETSSMDKAPLFFPFDA